MEKQINDFIKSSDSKNNPNLSHRQLDCARLLLQGMKYKEIAKELHLSARTIESYIHDLRLKLKCRNRTELVIKLIDILKVC